jgi:hypothetical protein
VEITYGSGTVSGRMFVDRLAIEECSSGSPSCKAANKFHIIGATCVEGEMDIFADSPFDGVMGLGLSSLAVQGTRPLIDILKANGQVNHRKFSFYLKDDVGMSGSRFFVGDVPSIDSYTHPLKYHGVIHGSKHWAIPMTSIKVGNRDIEFGCGSIGCPVVPDTGTSLITGPTKAIQLIADRVGTINEDCSNIGSLPDIEFVLGGQVYPLSASDYVYREGSKCYQGFYGMDMPSGMGPNSDHMFILGDSFLRRYFTEFDIDNNRVGLGKAK